MRVIEPFSVALVVIVTQALQAASAASNNFTSWSDRFQMDLEGVCVCSEATYDAIYNGHLYLSSNEAGVFSTSKAGDRLTFSTVEIATVANDTADFVIDTNTTYQSIIGFGGAFTDASVINVYLLNSGLQDILVDAYFGDDGDLAMDNFSVDMDKAKKIPFIQRAMNTSTRDMKMFGSLWSLPVWITENITINCAVQGYPDDEYWEALTLYYSKFVTVYEDEGGPRRHL
ncbi:hypothetical protein BBJ29_007621 [Phytophthora kernoviae]|uniref:Glycosyl hydrolase family 30 TIM-barrel domain-containing protein n=1 Tax=Phytophthora kernoviae TaxID=325452 RepID=A0A3F2RE02_9STRA|nr:hypothetical protein BBJ29_007621 [Phytophthora kernoviae]RLN54127.1 hypothetical protein BBP00_00009096 [Phytophthora kernoviae]